MGLSPDLFKRLSRLNRKFLRKSLATGDDLSPPEAGDRGDASGAEPLALEDVIPGEQREAFGGHFYICLLYTSPSPRDRTRSRMPSSA